MYNTCFLLIDATPSLVAHFNDSRCTSGSVCATDPLIFTCELNGVILLRVILPTGYQEVLSLEDTAADVGGLPAGFSAESLYITEINDDIRNISLTLSIANASLLNCGEIICDDTTQTNVVMAGCPVHGKSEQ